MNQIRPLISRAIAPFIAALVLRLALATGVDLPGVAESLTETATLLVLAAFAAVTGVGHKLMDRWINPLDLAALPASQPAFEARRAVEDFRTALHQVGEAERRRGR